MSIDGFIADAESARAETRRLQQELRRLRAQHEKARELLQEAVAESHCLRAETLALRQENGCVSQFVRSICGGSKLVNPFRTDRHALATSREGAET
jgi:hypothetical protein